MTWTTRTSPTTSWNNRTSPTTDWNTFREAGFILMEDGFYLLQETGDKLILDGYGDLTTSWTPRVIPT